MNQYDETDINLSPNDTNSRTNTSSYVVSHRIIGPLERPALITGMVKIGIVKNESQAIKVLIGVCIICVILTILLFTRFFSSDTSTLEVKYNIPEALQDQMKYGSQITP